jgi:hypothetical protein
VRALPPRGLRPVLRHLERAAPGQAGADAIDTQLHTERFDPDTRGQLLHSAELDELPDGAFVLEDGVPHLVLGRHLLEWTPAGYARPTKRPHPKRVVLITPPSLVAVLHADWTPLVTLVHPSRLTNIS